MCDTQIVINIRVVFFQLSRLLVLAYGLTVLAKIRVSLSERIMSLGIVLLFVEVLLVSCDCLLIFRFRFFALPERLVAEPEAEMGLGKIRIESDRFHKCQNCFSILIVTVEFPALVQQGTRAHPVLRQIVGHLRCSSTIIRALLSAALATGGQNH